MSYTPQMKKLLSVSPTCVAENSAAVSITSGGRAQISRGSRRSPIYQQGADLIGLLEETLDDVKEGV